MGSGGRIHRLLVQIGSAVYLTSFVLPAYWYVDVGGGIARANGLQAFFQALGFVFHGETVLAWLANPIVWLAAALYRRGHGGRAVFAGTSSLALALFGVAWLRYSEFAQRWNVHAEIAPYVWAGGIALIMAGLVAQHFQPKSSVARSGDIDGH